MYARSVGLLAAALMLLLTSETATAKRVALVIGNSAYENAPPLENPVNDATDMAAIFKQLGFEVILRTDLKKPEMERSVLAFADALEGADMGVFYYAGHGIQVQGRNYLVPIEAQMNRVASVGLEAMEMSTIQDTMALASATNVIFLDACRNNPFTRNLRRSLRTRNVDVGQGLAEAKAGKGTLISFATKPGEVALDGIGRNSPYTAALKQRIVKPGRNLSSVLIDVRNDVIAATAEKQVPWDQSALTSQIYFAGAPAAGATADKPSGGSGTASTPIVTVPQAVSPLNEQSQVWASVSALNSCSAFRRFLNRYGASGTIYAGLATDRLKELRCDAPEGGAETDSAVVPEPEGGTVVAGNSRTEPEPSRDRSVERSGGSCWDHNGSTMRLTANGNSRTITYRSPRSVMRRAGVRNGTVLFTGTRNGNRYSGQARVFSRYCKGQAFKYNVTGTVSNNDRRVVLRGRRPNRKRCRNSGGWKTDVLVFTYSHQC